MAFTHHDAAFHHQRRGGETEFIGPQQGTDDDVATGFHLAVGLYANTAAQGVQYQCLLGFSQAKLPRGTGVLDGRQG